jgi:hypothetical protein
MVLTPHDLRDVVVDSQPRHDPSPALGAFVDARDRFCDGPTGTRVPAARTDRDHDTAWPDGPTAAWNLISRAGRTHQLKHAGWRPVRDGAGTTWTSPAGQVIHAPAHHHPPIRPRTGPRRRRPTSSPPTTPPCSDIEPGPMTTLPPTPIHQPHPARSCAGAGATSRRSEPRRSPAP